MADHLTEEEQIEALKNWFKEYWMSIVLPIVIAAAVYFGWNTWQTNKEVKAKQGSILYQEMIGIIGEGREGLAEEQKNEATVIAQQLVELFGGTLYANRAKLVLARIAAEDGKLDVAAQHLLDVIAQPANEAVTLLAKSRLARVYIAQNKLDDAITTVSAPQDDSFKSIFAEIRGDALAAQGQVEAARTAYQEAMDNLGDDFSRRGIIDLKLQGASIVASVASGEMDGDAPEESAEEPKAPAATEASAQEVDAPQATEQLADEGNS